MLTKVLSSLSAKLVNAHQILETVVLRTNDGSVFTINIGKSLLSAEGNAYGAKVTLMTNPEAHIGVCEGESLEQVSMAAQELIANALSSGLAAAAKDAAIPRPHFSTSSGKVSA